MSSDAGPRWLLLIHQLPAKPAYVRVKIWRRLQALGAVTVKNAVYALPANAETREDFAWLAKEIVESGGEAIVCEASFSRVCRDDELRALFDAARDEDYGRIAGEARELGAHGSRPMHRTTRWPRSPARPRSCASSSTQVVAIDFFGAEGRAAGGGAGVGPRSGAQAGRRGHEPTARHRAAARSVAGPGLGDARRACRSIASPRRG